MATTRVQAAPGLPTITTRRRTPLGVRALAGVAVTAAFVLVFYFGGVRPEWYLPVYLALYLATAAAAVAVIMRRWTPVWLPVHLVLVVIVLLPLLQIWTHSTVYAAAAQNSFLHLLAAACAFWLVSQVSCDIDFRLSLLKLFAGIAGALALIGIVQFFLFPRRIYGFHEITSAIPFGPFVDRDDFAAAIELLLPAALVIFVQRRASTTHRLAWGLVIALSVAAVVLSASRAGTVAIALELSAFGVWKLIRRSRRSRSGHGRSRSLLASAAVALLMLVVVYLVGYTRLLDNLGQVRVSASTRLQLTRSSIQMGMDRPWTGYGLGSWEYVYPRYQRFDDGGLYEHAHSDYAELFAEAGVPGMVCALGLVAAYIWSFGSFRRGKAEPPLSDPSTVVRRMDDVLNRCAPQRQTSGVGRAWVQAAFIAGVAAFCLHAAVDFLFHLPSLLLLFAVTAAAALDTAAGASATFPPSAGRQRSSVPGNAIHPSTGAY